MRLNLKFPATESIYEVGTGWDSVFFKMLINHKIEYLKKGVIIPDYVLSEIMNYAYRNKLLEGEYSLSEKEVFDYFCPSCLKAHTQKIIEKFELPKETAKALMGLFNCRETGHNGYYLDGNEVIKV